jgi:hypothetical protein
VTERSRKRLISGLRSVARRSRADSRARLHELVLCVRAAAVRPELLEVAALLDCTRECDSATASELHWWLTDGCTSPLMNSDAAHRAREHPPSRRSDIARG